MVAVAEHSHLDLEIEGMLSRIERYKQQLLEADSVVITLVCSDSRVVLPSGVQLHTMVDGSKQRVMYVGIPTIGGGVPSRSRLRGVMKTLERWGVNPGKLKILVTQHGDTEEIKSSHSHEASCVSCGLRKFFSEYKTELSQIREELLWWTREYKRKTNNPKAAPDRVSLEFLDQKIPHIMSLVTELNRQTGLPRRLIVRAAYRNTSFEMHANLLDTWDRVGNYLLADEFKAIFASCVVAAANYDHQRKELIFPSEYASLRTQNLTLPLALPARSDRIQSPENVIVSFGENAICLHNGVLLPHLAGSEARPDNVFRSAASIPSVPTVMCALAEAFYAVVHKVHPHGGNQNFADLQRLIMVCDSQQHVQVLKEAVASREFEMDFKPTFAKLNDGQLIILNLHSQEPGAEPTFEALSLKN